MKQAKNFIVAALVLAIAILGVYAYARKSAYEVVVQILPEQRAQYEAMIIEMSAKITAVKPPEKPDIDYFIEKARAQEYLGRYGEAIDTLLNAFEYYQNTTAGWNNIAKLYDKVGDYGSAIIFYNKLIDNFSLSRYYLDVAWDYYRLGRLEVAREAYGRYTQLVHGRDEELFNKLYSAKSP